MQLMLPSAGAAGRLILTTGTVIAVLAQAWCGEAAMLSGAHVIIYSKDAEADRCFMRDVLKLKYVDAHGGWLIFGLPPSEMAVHPSEENDRHELYLMTDDLDAEIQALQQAGIGCGAVSQQSWGRSTSIRLPGGGTVGLYQPRHLRP
jgi:catechol 2,3-dioxygenase-like lactoylglutathione lyase family enzyme